MQEPPAPPPGNYPQQPGQGSYPAAPANPGQKRNQAFLSYLLTWITGLIFLYGVKPRDPDVRFHAAQAIVWFGGLTVLQIVVNILSSFVHVLSIVGYLVGLVSFISWIYCLVKAWTGEGARFEIPLASSVVTPYAEQMAGSQAPA
jgi:uncharacterized membrane protein